MPALGDGLALLKWITSFPGNPARGAAGRQGRDLPVRRRDGGAADAARRPLGDRAAHRRRGRGRHPGARAPRGARPVGIDRLRTARGVVARCLAAAGYGPGHLLRSRRGGRRRRLADELRLAVGTLADAVALRDRLLHHSRAANRSIDAGDLRPGLHLNMLGADGPGQGRGDGLRGRLLRAVLRRVGAGVARRRADRRGAGRAGDARG